MIAVAPSDKTKFYNLLLAALLSFLSFSQTACIGNFSGDFPCDGYDLMNHFDKTTLSSKDGSDIWGWTDPSDDNEYAIVTFEDKTCFLNITDPINPIYLGFLNSNAGENYWRDVKVYQNHAFIVADNVGAHGMQVFDLTRLRSVESPPESFTADTVLTSGWDGSTIRSCHNIVINEAKGMAYLVGCQSANGGGPIFIDISNPDSPFAVGQYTEDGYTHDAQVVTYSGPDETHIGKEIFIGSNEDKVVIIDVTFPSNPIKIAEVSYSNSAYTHQGWFSSDMRYFLVGDERDEISFGLNTRTVIFDFLDLDNPIYHSQYFGETEAIDHNLYIKGDLVYEANYSSGLRILDISDINDITEVGYFDTYPQNNNTSFRGAWSVYPYFDSGNIIISDINRGFFIVRESGTLGAGDLMFNKKEAIVYPNPANKKVVVSLKNYSIKHLQLYNILSQKIESFEVDSLGALSLDVSGYDEGIYILKINNEFTYKIAIKR